MTIWGTLAGGFVGTLVLTTAMRAGTELRLTRMDLPFLLGTAFAADRVRARVVGYALHFLAGLAFAALYHLAFRAVGASGWSLGALLGLVHGIFAASALVDVLLPLVHPRMGSATTAACSQPLLERPGFLMLNYGARTPVVMAAAHVVYGAIVGAFTAASA